MLQYSLVTTVADRYSDFGEIGVACLRMVASKHGLELGSGMGNIERLYRAVPRLWTRHVFCKRS